MSHCGTRRKAAMKHNIGRHNAPSTAMRRELDKIEHIRKYLACPLTRNDYRHYLPSVSHVIQRHDGLRWIERIQVGVYNIRRKIVS